MTKYLILALLALGGCKHVDPIVIDRKIDLPGYATELCKDLEKISSSPSLEEVLIINVRNAEIYYDCKLKNKMKVDLINKITSTKE